MHEDDLPLDIVEDVCHMIEIKETKGRLPTACEWVQDLNVSLRADANLKNLEGQF